jgi:hypothetical protein
MIRARSLTERFMKPTAVREDADGETSMTGTITRLIDSRQVGSIAAEDGNEYAFSASSLRGVPFAKLALGTPVRFTPGGSSKVLRAESVELVR